ncbi:MFS transporter [Antrihabitans sp. YC2-6]|nr:MFS transporter [Antrihabitans sp. YC2-6]
MKRSITIIFAVTAGTSAGCLYYLQPLLDGVAADLGVSTPSAALLISATQIGYLCGLTLVVPLGDFLERRRMVPALLVGSMAALLFSALAPNFATLLVGVFVTGVTASAAQVVVPWSSALAGPEERGHVVGIVMSGLLLGILLSRVLSGAVAEVGGWRAILFCAAGVQLLMSVAVYLLAPNTGPATSGERYPDVLLSIFALIGRHSVLRQRMLLGFLSMACFSGVWTAMSFLLAGDGSSGYRYSDFVIGLFGLAGVAGAAGAPRVGRLADRGHLVGVTTGTWAIVLASWVLVAWGGYNVIALIVALLVFDFGIQGAHLANQTAVYALDPASRSRLTTAYMVAFFAGGVTGSVTGGIAYESGGWPRVCLIGFGTSVVALACWLVFWRADVNARTRE